MGNKGKQIYHFIGDGYATEVPRVSHKKQEKPEKENSCSDVASEQKHSKKKKVQMQKQYASDNENAILEQKKRSKLLRKESSSEQSSNSDSSQNKSPVVIKIPKSSLVKPAGARSENEPKKMLKQKNDLTKISEKH